MIIKFQRRKVKESIEHIRKAREMYMSPELKESWDMKSENLPKGEKNDIFSLGVILLRDYLSLSNYYFYGFNNIKENEPYI